MTITVAEINSAPVLDPIGSQSVDEGDTVSFTATAGDSDEPANTLTYSLSGETDGATIGSSSGPFSWTTDESDGPDVYTFTVIVSDGVLTDSEIITITVTAPNLAIDKTVELVSNPAIPGEPITYTTAQTSFTPAVNLDNGVYTWTVKAHDVAGNVSDYVTPPVTFILSTGSSTTSVYLPIVVKNN